MTDNAKAVMAAVNAAIRLGARMLETAEAQALALLNRTAFLSAQAALTPPNPQPPRIPNPACGQSMLLAAGLKPGDRVALVIGGHTRTVVVKAVDDLASKITFEDPPDPLGHPTGWLIDTAEFIHDHVGTDEPA
jgi:hypothetical protein